MIEMVRPIAHGRSRLCRLAFAATRRLPSMPFVDANWHAVIICHRVDRTRAGSPSCAIVTWRHARPKVRAASTESVSRPARLVVGLAMGSTHIGDYSAQFGTGSADFGVLPKQLQPLWARGKRLGARSGRCNSGVVNPSPQGRPDTVGPPRAWTLGISTYPDRQRAHLAGKESVAHSWPKPGSRACGGKRQTMGGLCDVHGAATRVGWASPARRRRSELQRQSDLFGTLPKRSAPLQQRCQRRGFVTHC